MKKTKLLPLRCWPIFCSICYFFSHFIVAAETLPREGSSIWVVDVVDGPDEIDQRIVADVSESNRRCGLAKTGSGTLSIEAQVSLSGTLTIEAGVLNASKAHLSSQLAVNVHSCARFHPPNAEIRELYVDSQKLPAGRWSSMGSVAAGRADFESPFLIGDGILTVSSKEPSRRALWKKSKYGFFVHYVWDGKQGATPIRADGTMPNSIDELADEFDAPGFARDLSEMGVEYVIFTAWHSKNFPLYPSSVSDRVAGFARSPKRDLLSDMIDECHQKNIRVLFYTHPEQAIDWNRDWFTDQAEGFAELIDRYGHRIDGLFLDENHPQGLMDMSRQRFHRLERLIRRRQPDLVLLKNFFGSLYATDQVMYEWGGKPGVDPMTWGSASISPIAHTIASNWIATKPRGEKTMLYSAEGIYRFTVMMAGSCNEGGGIAWATGPYVRGGWETGVMEEMRRAGSWIKPVAESICSTYPSTSYPTTHGTSIKELSWGVATRSTDDRREYLHVLKAPSGKTLSLPAPRDGKWFTHARLLPSLHPVSLQQNENGIQLTLSENDSWDPLNTVIALDVASPGGRAWINDDHMAWDYLGDSWQSTKHDHPGAYRDDLHRATADGDGVGLNFDGTELTVFAPRGAVNGMVDFHIDGRLVESADLTKNPHPRGVIFQTKDLSPGSHFFKAIKRGGNALLIDAAQICEVIPFDDPRVQYLSTFQDDHTDTHHEAGFIQYSSGHWHTNRDVTHTNTIGASFTIVFHGTGVVMEATGVGIYDFYLDGKLVQRTDMSASGQHRVIGYQVKNLPLGKHTLKGVMVGGDQVHVDTFSIYQARGSSWQKRAFPSADGTLREAMTTNTLGDRLEIEFEGADLDYFAPRSSRLGTVIYQIDGHQAKIGQHYGGTETISQKHFSLSDSRPIDHGPHVFQAQLNRGEQMQYESIRVYKCPKNR